MNTTRRAKSLPSRHSLAQAIAVALAFGATDSKAAVFNVTTNADSGPGSLRQAVLDADASPGADQITFNDGLGTIALTSGQIDITETLTITGPAAGQTIDAGGNSRVLAVTVADQPLTLENLTVTGGHTVGEYSPHNCANGTGDGGGICALSDFSLTNSTVSGNSTAGRFALGGGIFVYRGNATISDSTISGNSTVGDGSCGGGIYVGNRYASIVGNATLTNSTVSGNSTAGVAGFGGGLCTFDDATLTNSTVSGNSTAGSGAPGGGLFSGNVTLTNSTVSSNSTAGENSDGGGVHSLSGNVTLTNSVIAGNGTTGRNASGGGISTYGVTTLTNSTISDNSTSGEWAPGGGLFSDNVTLTNSTVSGNSTAGYRAQGGGISTSFGNAILTNSTISGNSTAGNNAGGGGLAVSDATLTNSTVTANQSAAGPGGIDSVAIFSIPSVLTLDSTILAANLGPDGNFSPRSTGSASVTLNANHSLFGDDPAEINGVNDDNVFTDTPGLDPLTDNGCAMPAGAPSSTACVHTHALLPDSPALETGSNPLNLTTDQRGAGFPRIVNAEADIGAFESGTPPNRPPVANAGPDQTAFVGDTVTLDGSGSTDVDGDTLSYRWSLTSTPAGSTATLSNSTAVMPTFTIDLPGTYIAQLIVNDGRTDSAPDVVNVSATFPTPNVTPVPALGPWGLALLSGLLGLIGWRHFGGRLGRRRE